MRFTKMHGLGNDFILIDCMTDTCPPEMGNAEAFSRHLCDRRFGIGADQLLLLYPSETADFRMRILNSDGSEVEMCGNGVRCFAKYVWDRDLSDKDVLSIETLAGVVKPEKMGDMVRVDMGEPALEPERIPVRLPHASGGVVDYPLRIDDREFRITCVSMGNPHAVIVVDDSAVFPVEKYGPLIEVHPVFPKKTNVEFIEIISRREIRMRVWERGAGETMACGTGASAVAVAASLKGLTDRDVTVHLRGGDLSIEWASDNHVYMTGPAVEVFEGTIDLAM